MEAPERPDLARPWAVVPLRGLDSAKTRLSGELDPAQRRELVVAMAERTLAATRDSRRLAGTVLVTADPAAARLAEGLGARTVVQRVAGLNAALSEGRAAAGAAGATAILVLPIDLASVSASAIDALVDAAAQAPVERPVVVLVPDRHGRGTNALLVAPAGAIDPAFGPDSRAAHREAAARAGATLIELGGPLTVDVDTADDLLAARRYGPRGDGAREGRLEVVALSGISEIRTGDDLGSAILAALAATPDVLPLQDEDVLVVTQKVVSKAEGAIVDLDGVVPRSEAIEWAARWERDPRQVEVVLREARRIVRMANGVIITETRHGFVCANGGVDASNLGPASGHIVTLLPDDPDASAARIRARVRERFGVDVPVVVSDSFGRPWRWGIVDVAIGVSGLAPLEDLRGAPDHDGRIMRSTIRAVADELASAAELALGKTAGRPVALVRGAAFTRAEGSIRETLMPPDADLFR